MLRNSQTVLKREQQKFLDALTLAPLDLKYIFLLKFLESYSYFTISQIITLFLTDEYGFDDSKSGLVYGMFGALISFYGIIGGRVVDKMGVKMSLVVGCGISLLSRILFAFSHSEKLLFMNIFFLAPLSMSMSIPVMLIGIKRLTEDGYRGFYMGVFYAIMNVGAALTGFSVDFFTIHVKDAYGLSHYRWILVTCLLSSVVSLVVAMRLTDKRLIDIPAESSMDKGSSVLDLFRDPGFRKFCVFSLLMVNLRCIFRHLDATLPKYLSRIHGENVSKGAIFALNPIIIIFLVTPISAYTANMDTFRVIKVGGLISALSPIYLVFSSSIAAAVLFVIQLSLGEVLWSPAFYSYQMSVATHGKEALFMAFASAPLYLAKVPSGLQSGYLLAHLLPAGSDETTQRPHLLWLIIMVSVIISPILIHLYEHRIRDSNASKYRSLPRHDSDLSDIFEGASALEDNA